MTTETVQANLKLTNKAQFERFTVHNLPKISSLYEFNRSGMFAPFPIATCNSHEPQTATVLLFECANDNIHLSINLLGVIVNGSVFT